MEKGVGAPRDRRSQAGAPLYFCELFAVGTGIKSFLDLQPDRMRSVQADNHVTHQRLLQGSCCRSWIGIGRSQPEAQQYQ